MKRYTAEEKAFIKSVQYGKSSQEVADLFNARFDSQITASMIKSFRANNHINSGITGNFRKGNIPWNKGMKGLQIGGKETQFRKGNLPKQYRHVGSERIQKDGYVYVKTEDPNTWRLKHRVIWERHHGRIPAGHTLIFLDGNKQNFEIDNLILVSRAELARINQLKLSDDPALNRSIVMLARFQETYSKKGERHEEQDSGS